MNLIFTLVVAAGAALFCSATASGEEKSHLAADNSPFEFTHFIRDRPLELGELIGKHFSEVVPREVWQSLPSPEEYKNPTIKYGVYSRTDLDQYMKTENF